MWNSIELCYGDNALELVHKATILTPEELTLRKGNYLMRNKTEVYAFMMFSEIILMWRRLQTE